MAKNSKRPNTRPTAPRPTGAGPRRLGNPAQNAPTKSSGAARRSARRQPNRTGRFGWAAVGVVIIVIAVFVIVRVTTSSTPSSSTSDNAGRNPAPAPASITTPVETVPAAVFNSIGIGGQAPPLTLTKGQPKLGTGAKATFVYVGGEYCPYCALMRWSMVAALSRFGTFTGLKDTTSASTDGNIPTFSFYGSTYTSKYLKFAPYEESDRLQNPLQPVPNSVLKLYTTYDGSGSSGTKFSPGGTGIPFLDINNQYVSSGDPDFLANLYSPGAQLLNGGPGRLAIAQAIQDPTSPTGKAIDASVFIVMANYLSAGICATNGSAPAAVCNSSGVMAATKALSTLKPVG